MAERKSVKSSEQVLSDLLRISQNTLIVQLVLAGVPQHSIREIVGVDMARVGRIAKHLKNPNRN